MARPGRPPIGEQTVEGREKENGQAVQMSLGRGGMAAGTEFVEGWLLAQVLGEGAYGEVRLLVHARSGACVALKTLRRGGDGAAEGGAREAALHRALRHPHVLRCLGERLHADRHYLFLEYAQGGELFDRIEPDAGMSAAAARRYWRQLLAGLRYLHARGVAHRDIKPENLLLDTHDRLKISDFGMATLFRQGARERLLSRVCGTLPYAAPEVLSAASRPYRAPPADVWSAGVVLFAMLAGELPWERASDDEPRYSAWCSGGGTGGAWRRLSGGARELLHLALIPDAARRAALPRLMQHPWLREGSDATDVREDRDANDAVAESVARGWCSQPAGSIAQVAAYEPATAHVRALLSHSQPAQPDELLVSSPEPGAQPRGVLQRLVRRLTRVWVRCDEASALSALTAALELRRDRWRYLHPRMLAVECGAGGGDLRMRVWAVRAVPAGAPNGEGARVVLEFRRSRGCGLQFKRRFLELRAALQPLAAPPPSNALDVPLDVPLDAPLDGSHDMPLVAPVDAIQKEETSAHEPMDET
ncbi:serine/threonine-protein kinase Chk1 isoform X2 [Battus philenor]|uniref:serine/threonine-protein kinase Chk1 isoform X2 n=1 Tax=Battus philenor TaxID=42288 RepID=UPI0035CF2475